MQELQVAIKALPFVSKLSPIAQTQSKPAGFRANLLCARGSEHGACGNKTEGVQLARVYVGVGTELCHVTSILMSLVALVSS